MAGKIPVGTSWLPFFDSAFFCAKRRYIDHNVWRCQMTEINWERDFNVAMERAKKEGKPIFHDFWFDG